MNYDNEYFLPNKIFEMIKITTLILPGAPAISDSLIIKVQGGENVPLFYVGTSDQIIPLLKNLDKNTPLYAIRSNWKILDSTEFNIKALAHYYVNELIKIYPVGSFSLASFCGDSMLAWEIAKQLVTLGRKVSFMALIETDIFNHKNLLLTIGRKLGYIEYKVRHKLSQCSVGYLFNYFFNLISKKLFTSIKPNHTEYTENQYIFSPLNERILFFYIYGHKFSFYRFKLFQRCWNNYALGDVNFHMVSGDDHLNPNWVDITKILDIYLNESINQPRM